MGQFDESRLDELLDRFQDLLDEGGSPSVAELCRNCPELRDELARRVARLARVGRLFEDDPPAPATQPAAGPRSISSDKTWVSHAGEGVSVVEIPAPPGYEVLEVLGEGGMGVVYKALQVSLNRVVALKMILPGARARPVDLDRFRAEARAIAALRHPNIVQVYETGEFRGLPFFSLEFCEGGPLSAILKGEPQPPRAAAEAAEVLARAVQYAHEHGIVHRDLKPGNILLTSTFQVPSSKSTARNTAVTDRIRGKLELSTWNQELKVTDFGLAKRVDDDSGMTQHGSVMGTPAYMSPEQAFGDTRDVTVAADVHALGAVLYELLTGRPPFQGSSVHETLEQVRHRDPVPVRRLQPKVPADLETICLKCLEKDPRKRYVGAADLADDLRRFLDGRPITARPVGRLAYAWRWARREPKTATLFAVGTLLAIGLPALLVGVQVRLSDSAKLLEQEQLAEAAARESADTQKYYAAISEARRLRTEARPGWTWAAQARLREAAAIPAKARDAVAIRSELATALAGIDLRQVDSVGRTVHPGAIAFRPTDGLLAIAQWNVQPEITGVGGGGDVHLVDPRTGKAVRTLHFTAGVGFGPAFTESLAFSPDGRWLVLGMRHGKVICWDLRAEPEPAKAEWMAHNGSVSSLAFSPDSEWLYTGSHDGSVRRWRPTLNGRDSDAPRWDIPKGPTLKNRRVTSLAYWDGPRAGLMVNTPGGCRLLDPVTLAELGPVKMAGADWVAPRADGSFHRFAVHPPTGTIAIAHGGGIELTYWERGVCRPVAMLHDPELEGRAHAGPTDAMSFHPSGMFLASVSPAEGVAKLWHLGSGELAAAVPAVDCRSVVFSPDGSLLAVGGDHATAIYEMGGMTVQTFLGRRGFPIRALGLTADGRLATVAALRLADRPDRCGTVVTIWDESGKAAETVLHRADGPVTTDRYRVIARPGGDRTAFHCGDAAVLWRGPDGKIETVPLPVADGNFDLAPGVDGRTWYIENGTDAGWRPGSEGGKLRKVFLGRLGAGRLNLERVVAGRELVLVGCADGYLRAVRATDQQYLGPWPCFEAGPEAILYERANTVHAVAVREDNALTAAGTEDGSVWLFRLPGGERAGSWRAHADRVTALAFDAKGEWLATGSRDREVRLWRRAGDGYEPCLGWNIPGAGPVRRVVFAADGRRLYVLRDRETAVRVWDLERMSAELRAAGAGW